MTDQIFKRLPQKVIFFVLFLCCCQCKPAQKVEEQTGDKQTESEESSDFYKAEQRYPLMGTLFKIVVFSNQPREQLSEAIKAAFAKAAEVNKVCSDYGQVSELMQLNNAPVDQPVTVSPMLWDILQQAATFVQFSDGVFDPTVGAHSYQWRISRLEKALPNDQIIEDNQKTVGWQGLSFDANARSVTKTKLGMRLDLGGVAKGYAADLMFAELQKRGFQRFSIACGGDLRVGKRPPEQEGWQVEILSMDQQGKHSKRFLILENMAISTSGDIHQFVEIDGKRFSHIIDPETGLGMTKRVSASVVAPLGVLADMYATGACLSHCLAVKLSKQKEVSVQRVKRENGELEVFQSGVFETGGR